MQPKTPKNKGALFLAAFLLLWGMCLFLPQAVYAYNFVDPYGVYDIGDTNNTINRSAYRVCSIDDSLPRSENLIKFGLTKRIVLCVKESIIKAVHDVLLPFSEFFAQTVAAACTLAVVIWGVQMTAGRRSAPTREVFVLAMKIGAVLMFTSNFAGSYFDPTGDPNDPDYNGLFGLMLDAMEDMLGIVISYATLSNQFTTNCPPFLNPDPALVVLQVWDTVDCGLDTLVGGIFSPISLSGGIVGFLIAALVSSPFGFFIAILGFVMIAILLFAIARCVYAFITAYMAFALMVLVSSMIIPLILFKFTRGYFDKWLRLTIGFILQPIFIFVYLSMLLAAYDTVIYSGQKSLFRAIAGSNFNHPSFTTIGNWIQNPAPGYDPGYIPIKLGEKSVSLNTNNTPVVCTETVCEANVEKPLGKLDTGVLGTVGEQIVTKVTDWQNDIFNVLNNKNIFKTSIPVTGIDWDQLAGLSHYRDADFNNLVAALQAYYICKRGQNPDPDDPFCLADPDPLDYLDKYFYPYVIGILLSAAMAVITAYIFMTMLDYLPFIGRGISGESLSLPALGAGKLAMPGSNALSGLRDKLSKNFLGGA